MRAFYQLSSFAIERRFWRLLASLLLAFTLGAFLWYLNDPSERYFKHYRMEVSPVLLVPWWQIELAAGEVLEVPVSLPEEAPEGRWFLEVLGHPVNSDTGGTLEIGGRPIHVDASRGPVWHRVYLDGRPEGFGVGDAASSSSLTAARESVAHPRTIDSSVSKIISRPPRDVSRQRWFTIRYRPESSDDAEARFRIWGASTKDRRQLRLDPTRDVRRNMLDPPRLNSMGASQPIFVGPPVPIPFRHKNVEPEHPEVWREFHEIAAPTPFFRVGVRTRVLGSKRVGSALILLSTGLLSLLLLLRFAIYSLRNPGFGLAVLLMTIAAVGLRYAHLSSFSDLAELTGNGFTVRDGVRFDSMAYFARAVGIFSNEAPGELRWGAVRLSDELVWPIGMPTFAAFLFQWEGIDLHVPKVGFAILQALVGPLLFFCCLPVLRNKYLAFIPLLTWTFFFRPMKYSYFFLTESLTMCLMVGWIAILFSRNPRSRDRDWLWILLTCSLLFALASYTRDVVVTFLPVFLGMVAFFLGSTGRQRVISVGCGFGIVVGLWCATPILFADKSFSLRPADFLPITDTHYRSSHRLARPEPGSQTLGSSEEAGVTPVLRRVLDEASSRPTAYLEERYADAKRFWSPQSRWGSRGLNDDPAHRESRFTRRVEDDLQGGRTYAALIIVLLSTAVFGLFFSSRWVALCGAFLYFTLFHALLFPGFTGRPKAIFFPFIVLFASAGVFAFAEGFAPWLRGKTAAKSE